MKNILLTFDYELFLGQQSGTVDNCLIAPTNEILKVLEKYNAHAIFFIDATFLTALEQISRISEPANMDFINIQLQVRRITNAGHFAYLHLHPHWQDALFDLNSNSWNLSGKSCFSFQCINETGRKNIFNKSAGILNQIISHSHVNTAVEGFRAGGLYIQPFTIFTGLFDANNIKYDFSVLPGTVSKMENFSFDFSSFISDTFYRFSEDILIPDMNGRFKEYCISQIELKNLNKIINGIIFRILKRKKNFKSFGDGASSGNIISSKKNSKFYTKETLSVELLNNFKMKLILKMADKTDYLHFISHTKLISPYNIKVFDKLLKTLNKRYEINYNHKNFPF